MKSQLSMRSIVYHQFRKELHIIKTKFCISSSRQKYTPKGMMICAAFVRRWYTRLRRDDIPSLSAWIKKFLFLRTGIFWDRHSKWNRSKTLDFTELGPGFSLRIYYNIKRHSLQHKNAESSLEIYNGNTKQTPAKLQPLSNNIFSWYNTSLPY